MREALKSLTLETYLERDEEPVLNKVELPHDKTNKMTLRPVKTQISLASAQSDQSLRCPHDESLEP